MKYFFNKYHPVIADENGRINFPLLDNTYYKSEEFQCLLQGEGLDEGSLINKWGSKQVAKWKESGLLLPYEIDEKHMNSRTDSFYYFLGLKNAEQKLANSKVLILGCGGIGSHVAWNMTALGVKHIYLLDGDVVELSNLNRQILYDIDDIGKEKVNVLASKLKKINPNNNYYPINNKIYTKEMLNDVIVKINPNVIVKSFDSPIYISKWLEEICELGDYKYVSAIMNGTKQLIGPTYIGRGTAHFGDYFEINQKLEKIGGIAPSICFELSGMAAEVSEEVYKLLTGFGELKYKNRIIEYENITNQKNQITTITKEVEKGGHKVNLYKNILRILLLYIIIGNISDRSNLAFIVALLNSLFISIVISGCEKEAIMYNNIFVIFMFLFNFIHNFIVADVYVTTIGTFFVYFTTVITILSVVVLLCSGLVSLVWNMYYKWNVLIKKKKV